MHTFGFGQAYWIDLLKRIIRKLICYFSEFCTIYYEFLRFKWIFGVFNSETDFWRFKQISGVFNSETNFWKLLNAWIVFSRYSAHSLARPKRPDGPSRSAYGAPAPREVTALGTDAVAWLPPAHQWLDHDSIFTVSSTETWAACRARRGGRGLTEERWWRRGSGASSGCGVS
jgi:hypothetical protein